MSSIIPHRHGGEDSNGYFRHLTFYADFLGKFVTSLGSRRLSMMKYRLLYYATIKP